MPKEFEKGVPVIYSRTRCFKGFHSQARKGKFSYQCKVVLLQALVLLAVLVSLVWLQVTEQVQLCPC